MSNVTAAGEPQFSDDRQWWWTGTSWVPASTVPSPALLTAGAVGSLGLALLSWVLLWTPFTVAIPFTAICAFAVGRAALHSLPKTFMRDRWIAGIGMVIGILPLALIVLGTMALMLTIAFFMLTGNH